MSPWKSYSIAIIIVLLAATGGALFGGEPSPCTVEEAP